MFRPRKHQDMAEELVLLDNGCICCTVRGDLIQTLHNIGKRFASGQVEWSFFKIGYSTQEMGYWETEIV